MEEYAASVKLTYNQIRIWFVERRRKERRGEEQNILGMKDCLGGGRVHTHECSSKWSVNGRFLKHMHRVLGGQSAGRKRLMRLQILFPRDYILRKVFRKDGPPLGAEFDPLPNKEFDYRVGRFFFKIFIFFILKDWQPKLDLPINACHMLCFH